MLLVGIDLSLRSPGVAVFDMSRNVICVGFMPQTKTQSSRVPAVLRMPSGTEVRLISMVPGHQRNYSDSTVGRSIDVVERIMHLISTAADPPAEVKNIRVRLEGYSFGKFGGSSSVTVLSELNGILKAQLETSGIGYEVVAPNSVKKSFTGQGNADKLAMFERFQALTGCARPFAGAGVPSPWQDMADAFAILTTFDGVLERIAPE